MKSQRLSGEIAVTPRDQKEGEEKEGSNGIEEGSVDQSFNSILQQKIRGAENMSKYTLDASVTSKGESNMDFSALDEKLGKGIAEALSTMIRESVVQGIIAVLPEIVKTLSNTAPVVTPPSDPLKEVLDANPSMCLGDKLVTKKSTWRCKGRKRGLPVSVVKKDLQFAEKLPPGRP
ncbi:uncharacterized protein DS421_18g612220 [Arachis hypogaea]|nr:uncharacterized protein DS421_18g612220 [Arachis hypogaea]